MSFSLTTEELQIQRLAKEFNERELVPLIQEVEREHRAPRYLPKKFAEVGLMGIFMPGKYRGGEASVLSYILAMEQLAQAGTGLEWLMSSNNRVSETLRRFGSEEIKEKYIPPLCKGEKCASTIFTEPETGSDPRMITTTAIPDGDNYIINGTKRLITWGAWDGPAVLYAKDETGRVSAFVIDKNADGYSTDPPYEKMGLNGMESVDVYFGNVKIPKGNLIGEKGRCFDILLPEIALAKIDQCARCLGLAEAALDESVKYAKQRMLRSGPMAAMQGIQWMLAEMQTKIEAARWLTYKCASLIEENSPDLTRMAALAKNFVIPAALDVCCLAMQIHSAYGYTRDFKVERLYRAAAHGLGVQSSLQINKTIIGSSLVR